MNKVREYEVGKEMKEIREGGGVPKRDPTTTPLCCLH